MKFHCLKLQDFDTDIFGLPFYRVVDPDPRPLSDELDRVVELPAYFVDAKAPAEDIELSRFLQDQGFAKACLQPRFAYVPAAPPKNAPDPEATAEGRLSPEDLDRHAQNLRYQRFNLDNRVPPEKARLFQRRWLENSMASATVLKVYHGPDFISFKTVGGDIVIDIVSVLTPGRGAGTALLDRVKTHAFRSGARRVLVTTECENLPACRFYLKNAFTLEAMTACFHLVKP